MTQIIVIILKIGFLKFGIIGAALLSNTTIYQILQKQKAYELNY